ncbi:uncharacterized protein Bfra_004730 [Botrytis fragariae]|uniref:Uncharacterized protein n=1 Tax=Botrytis fragariae TaxID=1964551 RepID=A0A8H6AWE8_9HELO|nr:uncharacterized protein Bfra_004730 [Botrytis fragariae]KAF5874715.1 hypothetical protein Bfra_004730 [Botrytis fragariae]
MPPRRNQLKRKQSVATRSSARLAKKRLIATSEEDVKISGPDVEEPEVKTEPVSEDEAPLPVTPRIKIEGGGDDGAEADDEAEDIQGRGNDEDERPESSESEPEVDTPDDETDYERYMAYESDDPEYHEIRRRRAEIEVSPLPNLPQIPRLITTLRGNGRDNSDQRLIASSGTNRLPNFFDKYGTRHHIPIEVFKQILDSLYQQKDDITATSVSLTNVFNYGLVFDIFGLSMCGKIKNLLQCRPVETWETGFFDLPFLSAPSSRPKICLRHVLHSWFPERLTWIQYGKKLMYHGPISLKLIKRYIRRTEGEGQRRALKEHKTRLGQGQENKLQRQRDRKERIENRRNRRIARLSEIREAHAEDSEFSDDHNCVESQCALNPETAHKKIHYISSGRDPVTDSEAENSFVEDSDDIGWATEDSMLAP